MFYCFDFHDTWIKWIMTCITTVSYSIQINGHKTGYFHPSRGIRQGDPLFPCLFLFCVEGLSHKIKNFVLQGLRLSQTGPTLTHLLFVDDSIIYTKATSREAGKIKNILHSCTKVSGQTINMEKSSIFFSPNTPSEIKRSIAFIYHITKFTQVSWPFL